MTAAAVVDLARQDDRKTRVELVLQRVKRQWLSTANGSAFMDAILDFLSVHAASLHTARSYSYSVVEFLSWLEREKGGTVPTPDLVRRADAARYVQYLSDRRVGLTREWLAIDSFRPTILAIYRAVEQKPGATITEIQQSVAAQLPGEVTTVYRRNPDGSPGDVVRMLKIDYEAEQGRGANLEDRLGQMVLARMLRREPSLDELRRGAVAGVDAVPVMERPSADIFRYFPTERQQPAVERTGAIATRLHCLQSLWAAFIKGGENVAGGQGLLRYNVWDEVITAVSRTARSRAATARARKTPDRDVLVRILMTTFQQFGDPRAAAELFSAQRDFNEWKAETRIGTTFTDLRDRVVILLMSQMGLRRSEIGKLTWDSISEVRDPRDATRALWLLTVWGKGQKERQIAFAPPVQRAVMELIRTLDDTSWRATPLERRPIAPIIKLWGRNGKGVVARRGMTGSAIAMMLRRRAMRAGIMPGDVVFPKVHAHGFRHYMAQTAVASGTPINTVQAILGHASLATTSLYVEVRDPGLLLAQQFRPRQQGPGPLPAAAQVVAQTQAVDPLGAAAEAGGRVSRKKRRAGPTTEETGEVLPSSEEGLRQALAVGVPVAAAAAAAPPLARGTRRRAAAEKTAPSEPEGPTTRVRDDVAAPVNPAFGDVYAPARWGETGDRHQVETRKVKPDVAAALQHVYVGNRSNLVWWDGSGGTLKPQMPVMSGQQLTNASDVWRALGDLWDEWGARDDRGGSAQRAMAQWVFIADDMASSADLYAQASGIEWVPFDAPSASGNRKKWRLHAAQGVARWFETVAWQWNMGVDEARTTRESAVRAPHQLPVWVRDPERDPLEDYSLDERHHALDWAVALTGGEPPFLDYSDGVRQAIELLRGIDGIETLLMSGATSEKGAPEPLASSREALERLAKKTDMKGRMAAAVLKAAAKLGAVGGTDIINALLARREARKGKPSSEAASQRVTQYLEIVEKAVGESAAKDPVVVAYGHARTGGSVSLEIPMTVDRYASTVRHERPVIDEWARRYKLHSECVARRLVRLMWDAMKKRRKLTADEVRAMLSDAQDFSAPCSRAQERELRAIVGARTLEEATRVDQNVEMLERDSADVSLELRKLRAMLESGKIDPLEVEAVAARIDLLERLLEERETSEEKRGQQVRDLLASGVPVETRQKKKAPTREDIERAAEAAAFAAMRAEGLQQAIVIRRRKMVPNGRPRFAINPMRLLQILTFYRG